MPPGSPKEQRNPPDKMSQGKKKKKIDTLDSHLCYFFSYSLIQEYADQMGGKRHISEASKGLM